MRLDGRSIRHLLVGVSIAVGLAGPLLVPAVADAQRLVLLVRHAERADGGVPPAGMTAPADPDLSADGRVRANRLAEMLAQAGITRIVVSEFKRTHQTAAPLAARLGLTPERSSSKDVPGLVKQLASHPDDVVLIIGHNTTVPAVIAGLGGPAVVIPDTDYANLFVFVPATRVLTTLRY
jgi:broad specificity phosphatase PhoE